MLRLEISARELASTTGLSYVGACALLAWMERQGLAMRLLLRVNGARGRPEVVWSVPEEVTLSLGGSRDTCEDDREA